MFSCGVVLYQASPITMIGAACSAALGPAARKAAPRPSGRPCLTLLPGPLLRAVQMVFGVLPFHRTLDGRPLDFRNSLPLILDNMKARGTRGRTKAWPRPQLPQPQHGRAAVTAAWAARPDT